MPNPDGLVEVPVAVHGCGSLHRVHMAVARDQLTKTQWNTLSALMLMNALPIVGDSDLTELRLSLNKARRQWQQQPPMVRA